MHNTLRRLLAPCAIAVVACTDLSGPELPASGRSQLSLGSERRALSISALTRNVYIGAEVDAVLVAISNADPADDLPALLQAVAMLQLTAFPARANALAEEIGRFQPDVVGLQEITDLSVVLPLLGIELQLEFLPLLMDQLAARGLNYSVAAVVGNSNVLLTPAPGHTVEVHDYDVLLVNNSTVEFNPAQAYAANFSANVGPVAPGVELIRGFVSIPAVVKGIPMRIVNTHLESGDAPPELAFLRALQAQELAAFVAGDDRVIVLGDLNDLPGSPMHQVFQSADLVDVWSSLHPGAAGATCCHAPDLSNPVAVGSLTRRFDYVFVRGFESAGGLRGSARLLGTTPGERVPGPEHRIWPSDHAGLLVELLLPTSGSDAR